MALVELPEVHEGRSKESELYKLVNLERRRINENLGEPAALALAAVQGFATAPTCAGVPVGVPDAVQEDRVPWIVDTVDFRVYFRVGGAWRYAQLV